MKPLPFSVEQVVAIAESMYEVPRAEILQPGHRNPVSKAKHYVVQQLAQAGFSSGQIARWLGYRDHTAILYLMGRKGTRGPRKLRVREPKPEPLRHPRSFICRAGEEIRKRWEAERLAREQSHEVE